MEDTNSKVIGFAEVYYIMKHSKKELQEKIPKEVVNDIYEKMDKNYEYDSSIELSPYGKAILSVIVSEYLADEPLKNKFDEYDAYSKSLIEKKKQEQYRYEDMFLNKMQDESIQENIKEETQLIVPKESFWTKIKKIFSFFRK